MSEKIYSSPQERLVKELAEELTAKLGRQAQSKYKTLENGEGHWLGVENSMSILYHHTKSEYHEFCSLVETLLFYNDLLEEMIRTPDDYSAKMVLENCTHINKKLKQLREESVDLAALSRMLVERITYDLFVLTSKLGEASVCNEEFSGAVSPES